MAEIVGEALLSGLIDAVLKRFLSHETANLILGKKLNQELLEKLELALLAAGALVDDAEKKQFHDTSVKDWLHRLKDLVYDADDLLDTVYTKAATHDREVSNFLNRFLNFKDREIVAKMEEIIRKIEVLEKHKDTLGLKNIKISKEKLSWRTPSTSLIEGEIYGRENEKEAMIKLLKDESIEVNNISVIPIVGMSGVGKTTLAQWLYNNEDLMKEFDLKAWICVSEEFEIVKITRTIIQELTHRPCGMKNLNGLQQDLKEKLMGKKFFIVLDDVRKHIDWNSLKKPFQYRMKGSKILVTARNNEVASVFQTCPPYLLNELSDESCWSVFANLARFPKSNGNPALEKIGRDIIKKCKGLPLVAQTLGDLLRGKHDVKEWKTILNSEIWDVKDNKIIPALLISYYDLPRHLKHCFIYCSLYPKDYKFHKNELTLLWMAEGLLPSPKRGDTLEEVGYQCFDELASRLFFKQFNPDDDGSFVMHDLIHDLATSLASEFYFRLEELGDTEHMSWRTRHLSYASSTNTKLKIVDAIGRAKSLRTILPNDCHFCSIKNSFNFGSILSKLKCLRVLSFAAFKDLDVMPDSIGELIHLRYLDLSQTRIKTLPESVGNLYNLQTLKLRRCYNLTMLPNSIQNLMNLRHLDILGTHLKNMPQGISKLNCLLHLDYFYVGTHKENGIMLLGGLSNTHSSLTIRKLENVGCSSEALEARIMDKIHVETLDFQWSTSGDMVPNIVSQVERDIFDKLKPREGLKGLSIKGYRGTLFPNWVGHSSYQNMTKVILASCMNCFRLPSLGQLPSLKFLSISNFNGLKKIGEEFYKSDDGHSSLAAPFPSLEELKFCEMASWEVWHSSYSSAFPQLKMLSVSDCPKLTGDLPVSVKKLEIYNCRKLEFPRQQQHEPLQSVEIIHICDPLTSFPLDSYPKLISLRIRNCENLEFLSVSQSRDVALQKLTIIGCPNLVSFPGEGLAAPNMSELRIGECDKLKSLPCHMNTLLPKLKYLWICNCPEIESFLDGGLPPNFQSLVINNCEKLLSGLSSMGVHHGLTELYIDGPCENVKSFPKQGSLPHLPSLTSLLLFGFSSLETLDCKELLHLTPSLQKLQILDCPKLENMTGERLPESLIELRIYSSTLLEERCKTKDLQIWPKISHIPGIDVNGRSIT